MRSSGQFSNICCISTMCQALGSMLGRAGVSRGISRTVGGKCGMPSAEACRSSSWRWGSQARWGRGSQGRNTSQRHARMKILSFICYLASSMPAVYSTWLSHGFLWHLHNIIPLPYTCHMKLADTENMRALVFSSKKNKREKAKSDLLRHKLWVTASLLLPRLFPLTRRGVL